MACAKVKVEFRINRLYNDLRSMKREAKSQEEVAAFDVVLERIGRTLLWTADNFPDPRKKGKQPEPSNDNSDDQAQAGKVMF